MDVIFKSDHLFLISPQVIVDLVQSKCLSWAISERARCLWKAFIRSESNVKSKKILRQLPSVHTATDSHSRRGPFQCAHLVWFFFLLPQDTSVWLTEEGWPRVTRKSLSHTLDYLCTPGSLDRWKILLPWLIKQHFTHPKWHADE